MEWRANLSSICKDLVAGLQNSAVHIAHTGELEKVFRFCMAAHHPRRLVRQSQTLQFVFHSRSGQKKSHGEI